MKEREVKENSPLYNAAAFEGLAENDAYDHEDRLAFALTANRWLHRAIDEMEKAMRDEQAGT